MRLWHKDLIPYLPRKQLLSQWRECCCIACNITINGTPNHILVNKIMDYPMTHFVAYSYRIYCEFRKRQYNIDWSKFTKHTGHLDLSFYDISDYELFAGWHNKRYLDQCYYNLQEKYDCGGIPDDEWLVFSAGYLKESEKII